MEALLARLRRYVGADQTAIAALSSLPSSVISRGPAQTLVSVGEPVTHVFLVEEGWAMRHRMLSDGRRQIVNFMVAGDCFDLQSVLHARADHAVTTLTNIRLRTMPASQFLTAIRAHPALASAFWWLALQEESILREQILRIGRRSARERVAHLILELHRRLLLAGAPPSDSIALPLTRETMADCLGLSAVHVSRTLSALRARRLIETNGRTITLRDRDGLSRLAQFNDGYLHIRQAGEG